MAIPYDVFTSAFLGKIREYDFLNLEDNCREEIIDGYMKRALRFFNNECEFDLLKAKDDTNRIFRIDIPEESIDEIVDIVSEGMVVQWLKPFLFNQDLLENVLNTRDYSVYSPANLSKRIGDAHREAQSNFKNMIIDYTYDHGNISGLHL